MHPQNFMANIVNDEMLKAFTLGRKQGCTLVTTCDQHSTGGTVQ